MHRLSREEQLERNARIQKKIELGVSYQDISRMYGLTEATICGMVKKGKLKSGIERCFGHTGSLERCCFGVD
jgi:Mor family transcriptional regulator